MEEIKEKLIRKIFKECTIPCIMVIISFVLGLLWLLATKTSDLIVILFTCIPFIIFLFFVMLMYLLRNKKIVKIIINYLCIFLTAMLPFYCIIVIFITVFSVVLNPVTDINKYEKSLGKTELLVFPSKIPDGVQNVEFIDQIGFLQGGSETALYYIDPNLNIEDFDKKYREDSIWIGNINDYTEISGLLDDAFSNTPSHYTNEEDYTIYLIDGRCDDSGYCNHGEFLMVAINPKTNEVVYKFEDW